VTSKKPPWDDALARGLKGSLVLIGLTQLDSTGRETGRWQLYGRVMSADEKAGIKVRLEGKREGETYTLPPATDAIRRAKPGNYELGSTGEVVTDPDFTITWVIQEPAN
jgi:hypothetical protein